MESYKELTCELLASMRYHEYDELDRADLDQGWGWITFLAKGERKIITFRQLEIFFGFTYGEGTHWDIKRMSSNKATGTINEGEVKLLDMGIKPIISRTRDERSSEEIEHTQETSCPSSINYSPTAPQPIALDFNKEGG
ncbi:unnamed protein product [Microthlaspi erraticum]|uniref:Arabidopsis retrotransposon Orf1 C-terminal domain-containing protein n=1 Tax=Microthlaspi erraticum TaxID=1685480 RepID=A0A6D2JVK8_9BRAS|nr:unnamed protein product [Microthlaspi erraticum]